MGKIVEPGSEPTKSVSTGISHTRALAEQREFVHSIIKRYDDEAVWDRIKSKEIPADVIDFVQEQLTNGFDYAQIRRQLGILRSTDKSWTKIMSALKQGYRIDGTAFLIHIGGKYKRLADKMYNTIETALEDGVEMPDGKGGTVVIKGPTKELATFIDAYNRLNQGFIKNGKDLGAFVEQDGKGGQGGVTIVVKTNVPMPTAEDIKRHQDKKLSRPIDVAPEDVRVVE